MPADRTVLLDARGNALCRPVVYLDHSTLVNAFEGKRSDGAGSALNAELAAVVEEVARRGTLCLSIIHLFELVRGNNAVAMASWLGDLDPLWFQMDDAADEELANEVRRRLGMKCTWPRRLPIHHAMTAAYRSSLFKHPALASAALSILSVPDLPSVVRQIHGNPRLRATFEHVSAEGVEFFARLHANRSSIPKGTPQQAEAGRRVEERVRKSVQEKACRLIAKAPVDWEAGESYPAEDAVRRAVGEALDDQDALPLTKVSQHIARYVSDGITAQTATSSGFTGRFKGFGWDSRHALAAAVVDVFTCDSFTDSAMADFRPARGMNRQISMLGRQRSDHAGLIAELRRQCAVSPEP